MTEKDEYDEFFPSDDVPKPKKSVTLVAADDSATTKNRMHSIGSSRKNRYDTRQQSMSMRFQTAASISDIQTKIMNFMQKPYMVTLMITMTLYALFAEDFRLLWFRTAADPVFRILHVSCGVYFTMELLVYMIAKKGYFTSELIYFILDVLSLGSVILDILIIYDLSSNTFLGNPDDFRAAKMAKIGTRVSRIIRALRFMANIKRIMEAGDEGLSAEEYEQLDQQLFSENNDSGPAEESQHEENIKFGTLIQNLLTTKVIIGVMIMIVFLPILQTETKGEFESMINSHVKSLERCLDTSLDYCANDEQRNRELKTFCFQMSPYAPEWFPEDVELYGSTQSYTNQLQRYYHLVEVKISSAQAGAAEVWFNGTSVMRQESIISNARLIELKSVPTNHVGAAVKLECTFDIRPYMKKDSMFQIIQTCFLLIILILAVHFLNNDTTLHVIEPVQRMLKSVQKLADDPFHVWEDRETHTRFIDDKDEMESDDECDSENEWTKLPPEHEIHRLQSTVLKISQLLALGFGRAGWNIIRSAVLKHTNTRHTRGFTNSGSKIHGIFLFTDIRGFTNVSECLQERITRFVNEVASVVHETTAEFAGATNKNIGDAFLAVWTFPRCVTYKGRSLKLSINRKNHTVNGTIPVEISDMVNRALIASIKIQIRIARCEKLIAYQKEKQIVKRFGENGFTVRLGAGLHVGWAIEGAIGTENHKIDATYLSHHVNISDQLECKTKLYKVSVIISEPFVRLLPEEAKALVRPVDHVKFKEFQEKGNIYTVDIPPKAKFVAHSQAKASDRGNVIREWRRLYTNSVNLYDVDEDLIHVQEYQLSLKEFKTTYERGFRAYVNGNWKEANELFLEALELKPEDGPCLQLIGFMEANAFAPPANWFETGRLWHEI